MYAGVTGIGAPEAKQREVELSGTNVGDITLQNDNNKRALFTYLGGLKD